MTIIFFIKSKTVNIDKYNIKDIPGSSGRLDVISRCILAALIGNDSFEKNIQIWVFLDRYGSFIFTPELFNYNSFPKNELMFSDYFADFLLNLNSKEKLAKNPLKSINISKMSLLNAIKKNLKENYCIFALKEDGKDFFKIKDKFQNKKIIFIIGSQEDEFLNSKELLGLNIPTISLGNQSYLASSVIRLLKLHLIELQ